MRTEPASTSPGGRTRTRNRRGEGGRLRDEILDAAEALLDEHGDERAITLRSVARQAGISAPSIYPHFADQPAIMLAVVQREFAELEGWLRTAADRAGSDPRARLTAVGAAYLDFADRHPGRYRTMFGGLWVPDLQATSLTEEEMATIGADAMRLLTELVQDCVVAGESDSTDAAADAVALWVGLHGLAHQRAVSPSFPWPDRMPDRIIPALARLVDASIAQPRQHPQPRPDA